MFEGTILNNLIAIVLLMIGNIATGIAKAKSLEEFNKQTLLDSLYKYGGVLLACACLFAVSFFTPDIELVEGYTAEGAILMIQNALILMYGYKLIENIIEILGIKKTVNEITTVTTEEVITDEEGVGDEL